MGTDIRDRVMQVMRNSPDVWYSCGQVGICIGVPSKTIRDLLEQLVQDEVIEKIELRHSRDAIRYRWISR